MPAVEETLEILKLVPDRIGHGTCLDVESGGSKDLEDLVLKHRIPLGKVLQTITTLRVNTRDTT